MSFRVAAIASSLALTLSAMGWQEQNPPTQNPPTQNPPTPQVTPGTPQPVPQVIPAGPKPKLTLSATSWDFGTAIYGDSPTYTLTLKNEGDADLTGLKVRGSCSCTVPQLKTDMLKPGESTEVSVTFNTKKKQGDISTMVTINSNDPVQPTAYFKVSGNVSKIVAFEPAMVKFQATEPTAELSATVKMINKYNEPMKPEFASINSDTFDVSLKEIEAGQVYEVVVKAKNPLPYGPTNATAKFKTGIARMAEAELNVSADIKARVTAVPAVVWLDDRTDTVQRRNVRVQYFGEDANFAVTEVKSADPALVVVEAKPIIRHNAVAKPAGAATVGQAETANVPLMLSVESPKKLPKEGVKVICKTNDPKFPELEVLVTTDKSQLLRGMGFRGGTTAAAGPAPAKPGTPTNPSQEESLRRLRELSERMKAQQQVTPGETPTEPAKPQSDEKQNP
ncbi:MAG: hypothetical protein CHACPFDD_01671 [Phycisphaerae bacterium]|nr:hypothetical protein [Phycisphaerae bacterium]